MKKQNKTKQENSEIKSEYQDNKKKWLKKWLYEPLV